MPERIAFTVLHAEISAPDGEDNPGNFEACWECRAVRAERSSSGNRLGARLFGRAVSQEQRERDHDVH